MSDTQATEQRTPPSTLLGTLRHIGPGLIIAAAIVGSGELIVTTKLGGDVGYTLLWFIILGCLVKVFVQIELGRYAISHGETTLQALDSVPGPRFIVGWMVYVWLAMYVATFFQVAGMVGALGDVCVLAGSSWQPQTWAIIISVVSAVLLGLGRYALIESVSTTMVALFTLFTVFAVGALFWTPYKIGLDQLASGLTFQLPSDFTVAFGAFGIIGVGASELIYYPYWCLEKGFGRAVGPDDGSQAWGDRARGWMRVLSTDAWVSMVVYTGATVAFYVLGAAVLHGKQIEVTDKNLIPSLSGMYSESFGQLGAMVFIVGAFVVLFSTIFIATASNGRLLADFLTLLGLPVQRNSTGYVRLVLTASTLLPLLYLFIYLNIQEPLNLVLIGALAQALMLPLLCLASLYFHHQRMKDQLKPKSFWPTLFLWLSAIAMIGAGGFQLYSKLSG